MVKANPTLLDKLNLVINIYGRLFSGILRISWWFPFFILALFQFSGCAALLWYYSPLWSAIVVPILSLFFPPQAFHYPQYYLVLPAAYAALENFVLGPTVWIIMIAVAVHRLGGVYGGVKSSLKSGLSIAFKRYPGLIAVWLLETILTLIVLYIPTIFLNDFVSGSPNRAAAVAIALQVGSLLASAILLYAVPGIIIDNKGARESIRDSVALFFSSPIMTFFIVLLPSVVRILLNSLMTDFAPRIISLLNPDLIPGILIIYIITGIFVNLFIFGGAVFAYRSLQER
jgi:hypothetical protein